MFFKFGFNIAKPPVHHASGAFLNPLSSRLPIYGISPYMVYELVNSQYFANKYY